MYRFLCLVTFLAIIETVSARTYTDREGREAWAALKRLPVTESSFHEVCDLMQDVGQTDLPLSYEILSQYEPMVVATGRRDWVHILLMGWAKAKESLNFFPDAERLYQEARINAGKGTRMERETLVGTVLMYLEWGKADSLERYIDLGEQACRLAADSENLSFIYTFKAMSYQADTASMRKYLQDAIQLSEPLRNKNALFTALFNYADVYCQYSPQAEVTGLERCLELAQDSTLSHKPRLYERSDFYFRNPASSVYYELMQVNLLLTDYVNAGKFADLFYQSTIGKDSANTQAPYYDAEMSIVKVYQGDFTSAREYLSRSKALFHLPDDRIPYISYFIASGLLAEHEGRYPAALQAFQTALKKGNVTGLYLMPPGMYYARALIGNGQLDKAAETLFTFRPLLESRFYSAVGYYYYRNDADLLKAQKNYPAYALALDSFYLVKDSLTNLNHFRAIQEVEGKLQLKDKEHQIALLNEENSNRNRRLREEETFFVVFVGLGGAILLLGVAFARNRQRLQTMQRVIDAEAGERRKVADELHDQVGTLLSLARLNISSSLEHRKEPDEPLAKAGEMVSRVSGILRDMSHRLTPFIIEQLGFRKALEDLAGSVNLAGKLRLQLVMVGFEDRARHSAAFLHDVYRIIQELLQNVLKHSSATEALLEVVERDDGLSVMVEDNGSGIHRPEGKGLGTIRSRVAYWKARMEITSKAEGGTLIVLEIPLSLSHAPKTDHS